MMTKNELKEQKEFYEKHLLAMIEIHHRLPSKLQKLYDEMIAEYIKELKILAQGLSEIS